jgi:hypothetical protein
MAVRPLRGSKLPVVFTLVLGALLSAGCGGGGSLRLPETSPFFWTSLPEYDAALRHYLTPPDPAGLALIQQEGPKDEVVRLVNEGLFLHRLGQYEASNAALQRAEALATDRYTKSITQNVAAFVVSDNVLDYYPSALERSMINLYGMLNYLALGEPESASVEARKANALLRRYGNDNPGRSFVNDAAVQYLAGMLQWGEREENDAVVSLRQSLAGYQDYEIRYGVPTPRAVSLDATRVARDLGLDDVAEAIQNRHFGSGAVVGDPAREADRGDLLLVIENGFIAHKKQQKLFVPVLKSERDAVLSGNAQSAVGAAFMVLIRTVQVMTSLSEEGKNYLRAHEDGVLVASAALSAVGMELMTVAWPTYELDAKRATGIQVRAGDGAPVTPELLEDLSAIAVRDFEERKTSLMLRMFARSLLKEASVAATEARAEQAGGAVAGLLGRVAARTAANATERADTRSWSSLPAEILLARFRLPVGPNEIQVTFQGPNGPETTLLNVDIEPGAVTIRNVAVWGRDQGDQARFIRSQRGVDYIVPRRSSAPSRLPQ